jgi:hypothetical protein
MRAWLAAIFSVTVLGCLTPPSPPAGQRTKVAAPPPALTASGPLGYAALARISLGDAAAPALPDDSWPADAGGLRHANRVVAGMRPCFTACYNRALAGNPSTEGTVRFTVPVGPGGDVVSATPSSGSELGDELLNCATSCVQKAVFDAPEADGGAGTTIFIPVTFAIRR